MAGEKLVVLAKHDGTGAIRINDRIGNVRPLHCTALGKVMLAARSKEQLDAYLETARRWKYSRRGRIRTKERLLAEIDEVRRSGIAFDDGEVSDELRCAAAPVSDFSGTSRRHARHLRPELAPFDSGAAQERGAF